MRALDWTWFSNVKGCIGIVRVQTDDGIQAYISAVDGNDEYSDVQFIMDWGARFPIEAANTIFKK